MKYAHIEKTTNKLLGWYDKEIHTKIPTPNIKVTDAQWQVAIDNGHNKVNKDGTTELFDFRTVDEVEAQRVEALIRDAKLYLDSTDYKFNTDYELKADETQSDLDAIKAKRSEARKLIRGSK